jgi:hypothetical protein
MFMGTLVLFFAWLGHSPNTLGVIFAQVGATLSLSGQIHRLLR